jgi:NDP-sugar pyrophosphorylase family protein
MSLLPPVLRSCITEADWWKGEMQGLRIIESLTTLALPAEWEGYRAAETTPSRRWPWTGNALVHETSVVHSGVNLFGPVLIGPHCEIGPNATIFGPCLVESNVYLGPSVEVRRSVLLDGAELSHMSYLGHSVIGRDVRLGAFFCSAVRNLQRGTVHLLRDGQLVDTGERQLGCVVADGTESGVHTTIMPGRRIVNTPILAAHSVVLNNC